MVIRSIGVFQNNIFEIQETALSDKSRHMKTRHSLSSAVCTYPDVNQKVLKINMSATVRQCISNWTIVCGLGRLDSPNSDHSLWTWIGAGILTFSNPVRVMPGGNPKYIRHHITHQGIFYKHLTHCPMPG